MPNRFVQALLGLVLISIVCSKAPVDSTPISSYTLEKVVPNSDESVFTGLLVYSGDETYYVNSTNPIIKTLNVTIFYLNEELVQVKIFDANKDRWELPEKSPFPFTSSSQRKPYKESSVAFSFDFAPKPFAFTITRKLTEEVIFSTKGKDFIFSNNYMEISTALPTSHIYGLGERTHKLNLGSGTYSLWNADSKQTFDDGKEGHSSHGFHPVYLIKEAHAKMWSMIHLRNVNAMSVEVTNEKTLTYRVSGGILDFSFFIGGATEMQPEGVVVDYHEYLGGWAMPPLWALGYHQSKSGYDSLEKLSSVVTNAKKHDLPLDAIWSDTDYLKENEQFLIDNDKFSTTEFKSLLNHQKKKWVPAINDATPKDSSFYSEKKVMGVFKKYPNGDVYVGKVGDKEAVCLDFFHSSTHSAWRSGLNSLKQSVPFSGLWLKTNDVRPLESQLDGNENNLPYNPTGSRLTDSSIALNVKSALGGTNFNTEFNLHNLNNFMESEATYEFLKLETSLPFVMAKSSVFGSGKYAGHIIDETNSSWEFLKNSIASISNFNIYGIPMTGSDICGSYDDASDELCARWMQLGALYPFARNHAQKTSKSQEPWLNTTVLETSRIALNVRYSLIKHYYSLFLHNLQKSKTKEESTGTGTVFRPLFFEYEDSNLFGSAVEATETQFLLGDGLMVAPIVESGKTSRNVYFPPGKRAEWFDFFTGKQVIYDTMKERSVSISAPLNSTIPLFLREGTVVATQDTKGVLSTANLDNVYKLVVGLEGDFGFLSAKGNIIGLNKFTEASVVTNCMTRSCLVPIEVDVQTNEQTVNVTVSFNKDKGYFEEVKISGLRIYGLNTTLPNIDFLTMGKEATGFDGTTIIKLNNGTLDIKYLTPRVLIFSVEEEKKDWVVSIPVPKSKTKIVS